MAMKVKAVERLVKFNKNDAGTYRYVMQPDLYIPLSQEKVIKEAALVVIPEATTVVTTVAVAATTACRSKPLNIDH